VHASSFRVHYEKTWE